MINVMSKYVRSFDCLERQKEEVIYLLDVKSSDEIAFPDEYDLMKDIEMRGYKNNLDAFIEAAEQIAALFDQEGLYEEACLIKTKIAQAILEYELITK